MLAVLMFALRRRAPVGELTVTPSLLMTTVSSPTDVLPASAAPLPTTVGPTMLTCARRDGAVVIWVEEGGEGG